MATHISPDPGSKLCSSEQRSSVVAPTQNMTPRSKVCSTTSARQEKGAGIPDGSAVGLMVGTAAAVASSADWVGVLVMTMYIGVCVG
jgi:hypothetical protein